MTTTIIVGIISSFLCFASFSFSAFLTINGIIGGMDIFTTFLSIIIVVFLALCLKIDLMITRSAIKARRRKMNRITSS